MRVIIPTEIYKGIADGSSLSNDRRKQILSVYEYVNSIGDEILTYNSLQEKIESLNIGISKSAIRTFFPLLGKLGFVNYKNPFPADQLFTNIGKVYMETYKSILSAKSLQPQNIQLDRELSNCLSKIQTYGILQMNEHEEYKTHGIWLALAILKAEKEIYWQEFLYFLYLLKVENLNIEDAIKKVKSNRQQDEIYEYINSKNENIAGTTYSYTHTLLLEADLIKDIETNHSIIQEDKEVFFTVINNNFYEQRKY